MTTAGWAQLLVLIALIFLIAPPLGRYIARVLEGGPSRLDRVFGPAERFIYRICRVDPEREQRWNVYALSVLAFSVVSFFAVYAIQRFQGSLPFNPTDVAGVTPGLAFNTAVSFMTNTNWQSYYPETTVSHLTQLLGLTVQNFVSAAVGHRRDGRAHPRARPRRQADARQLLGRPRPRHVPDPAPALDRLRGRAAGRRPHPEPRRLRGGQDDQRDASRSCPVARSPARSRSSSSARTAAGSSTRTRPRRSRTQRRSRTSSSCSRSSSSRSRSRSRSGRWSRTSGKGARCSPIMFVIWIGMTLATIFFEVDGNPRLEDSGANQTVTAPHPAGTSRARSSGSGRRARRSGPRPRPARRTAP